MKVRQRRWAPADFAQKKVSFNAHSLQHVNRRVRLLLIVTFTGIWTAVLIARLVSLQISDYAKWQDWALRQHFAQVEVSSERGAVVDRNNKLLAFSIPAGSVYIRPGQVKDRKGVVAKLAEVLNLAPRIIEEKFSKKQPFVWIQRQIPRLYAEKVAALNLDGVGFVVEAKRIYPYNQAASTLIGRVGIDGNGLSGIEGAYEAHLRGKEAKATVTRDALGKMIEISTTRANFDLPPGDTLKLTIDTALQMIMDEELEAGRNAAHAKAAVAILVDTSTGEVLGMSQAPSINFNTATVASDRDYKNLAAEAVFEPGSIMKPIIAAAALESGVVNSSEIINCEHGRLRFGRHTIKDVHPYDEISFRDVVVRSSNIGMTKIGVRLGRERLHKYLHAFGFGEGSGLALPGESAGLLRPLSEWASVDVATHSFGQGVAVTPLQVVRAVAAIVNGGLLPQLRIVDDGMPIKLTRVVSEKTALIVRDFMYGVVEEEHGTGKLAAIEGVKVGGKTGTAQKVRVGGRGYEPGAYVASFVGFVDATSLGISKNLALAVMIDEPHTNTIYGGALAAPVFKRIMQRTLHFISTTREINGEFNRPSAEVRSPQLMTIAFQG